MHKIRITFMLALLSAGILLASCKKDNNDEPTPSSSVTTDTTQVTPDNNPQNADNNGDNNQQNPDNPDSGENNPPTTNSIVINVAIEAIEGIESQSFTAEDVLVVREGETELGTLTYQDTDGNFSGELTTAPSADGVTLTATITTTGDATSSTVSIADLMEKCAHNYTGTFAYKTDDKVMLTDDKAYIEILMSPLQHNIDVTIGGEKKNFAMSNEGKVWIAVDGGTKFTTNFTNEETATAGKITIIDRSGFVDLGIEGGILWADKNIGATNVYDYGDYFAWGETTTKETYNWSTYAYGDEFDQLTKYCNKSGYGKDDFTDELTVLESADDVAYTQNTNWSMPTTEEFAALKSSCYWFWTNDYSGKSGYIVYKNQGSEAGVVFNFWGTAADGYSTADVTHIFLPAAGSWEESKLGYAGSDGCYWAASLYVDEPYRAHNLYFSELDVYAQGNVDRYYGESVRAVRRK